MFMSSITLPLNNILQSVQRNPRVMHRAAVTEHTHAPLLFSYSSPSALLLKTQVF